MASAKAFVSVVAVFTMYQVVGSLAEIDIIHSSNGVSQNIYKILSRGGENVLFSPISANIPLSLVYLAARGKTADELRSGLLLGSNTEQVKTGYRNFISGLNDTKLKLATRLFPTIGLKLNSKFLKTAQSDFDSAIEELDYSNAKLAAETINTFVNEKTNHKINNLIDPNSIDSSTRMVIVNAAHFKDAWKHQFSTTFESDFHVSSNEKVKVQMMVETDLYEFKDSKTLDAKVLKLSFQDDSYSMVIILPNKIDGLNELESKLTSIEEAVNGLTYNNVHVTMPKFKIESTLDLKETLQELGIKTLFSSNSDLSGLAEGEPLKVSDVIQKTFINVDEYGIEAAAATAILVNRESLLTLTKLQDFKADHPFVFAIMYNDVILFQGRVTQV